MRFWDSSALVPLFHEEGTSRSTRELVRRDPIQVVWLFSVTEVVSALCRRHREGCLDSEDLGRALDRLARAASRWVTTRPELVLAVREEAARLLRRHALRAADAVQLAAAFVAFDRMPSRRGFVTLDDELFAAAEAEGFAATRPDK